MMAASGILKWGIISAGKISRDFTTVLNVHPDSEHQVIAVAARELESAQTFAKDLNIPKAYGSYDELLKEPDIDIVYIGAIHPYHFGICKLAINAGKHVVCEKPMTMNEWQAKEILDLVKEKGVFFLEGFWSRFFPAYEYARQQVQEGAIGDVKFVQASFGFELSNVPRMTEKELGGGALLDLGCYTVQFANMIFNGKPKKIVATGGILPTGVDAWSTTTLHYDNGCAAQLTSNMSCELSNSGTIHGTKGVIRIPNFWSPTGVLTPSGPQSFPLPEVTSTLNFINSQGFYYEQKHVREAILQGKKECNLMPHSESLQIMNIMDEVRRQLGVTYDEDDMSKQIEAMSI